MKKLITIILIAFMFFTNAFCQNLHVFEYEEKFGYFDDDMKCQIQPIYKKAQNFVGDYAIVTSSDGCIKIIDKKNTVLHSMASTYYEAYWIFKNIVFYSPGPYSNSPALFYNVATKKTYSSMDEVIKAERKDEISFISYQANEYYNLIRILPNDLKFYYSDHKNNLVNQQGKIVVEDIIKTANQFGDGLLAIKTETKSGFINTKGTFVFTCTFYNGMGYGWSIIDSIFNEGFVPVLQENKKWYIFDKTGKSTLIDSNVSPVSNVHYYGAPPKGIRVNPFFNNGLLLVTENAAKGTPNFSSYGFINTKGELVIPCEYTYALPFENNFALVKKFEPEKKDHIDGVINTSGKFFSSESILNN